jgi:hypothetical protein
MATEYQRKSQTRLIIAVTLFTASIAASLLISLISHSGDSYWITRYPLPKGHLISREDVSIARSTLPRESNGYLSDQENPIGTVTRHALSSGELLHQSAIAAPSEVELSESISLAMKASDIPPATSVGEMVSLYQVHDMRNGEELLPPQLILSPVFIKAISTQRSNFGGELSVTVSVNRSDVAKILAATTSGRIVLVQTHG